MRINITEDNLINDPPDFDSDARFTILDKYEAYFRNTIYNSRKFTWDGRPIAPGGENVGAGNPNANYYGTKIPDISGSPRVSDRKPSVVYPMARMIVNRFVSLLFGEHRFPRFHWTTDPNTEEWFAEYLTEIYLKENIMEAATNGGAMGSSVLGFKILKDRIQVETFNSKWVTPIWEDFHAGIMEAFRFMYPYVQNVYNEEKEKFELKWFLYRRVITKMQDIVFEPQELIKTDNGEYKLKNKAEKPIVDKKNSSTHNLGFVPAIFLQNIPRYDQIDGDPSPEGGYELFDSINEQLSAIQYALHGNLDPTLVIALDPEEAAKLGYKPGQDIQLGSRGKGLVVGANGSVKFLEMEGEALRIAIEFVEKLREKALEVCQCVIADPVRISGNAQSAAAIVKLFEYMLAKADILRCQYGERGMKPFIVMIARALEKYPKLVTPLKHVDENGEVAEIKPNLGFSKKDLQVVWPDYFEPMMADIFQAAEAASMARAQKPVTTVERAVKFLAQFLKDPNPLQTIRELKQEEKETIAREEKNAQVKLNYAAKGE